MTTLFGSTAVPVAVAAPKAAKKNFWLPLLIVLFLMSYGMVTLLIIEQGATIESQRLLIQELFRDSNELSAVKNRAISQADIAHPAPTQAQSVPAPSTQVPSLQSKKTPSTQTEIPSTQVPTPSTQVPATHAPQHRAHKSAPAQKPLVEAPSRPASDLADELRAVITL